MVGVNRTSDAAFNGEVGKTFNVIPWVQDTSADKVWANWQVTYRDVLVLDAFNRPIARDNLTSHDLGNIQYSSALKAVLLKAAKPADSDRDGLPDEWEFFWLGHLASSGASDDDGDGVDNLNEFTFGSAPNDAASRPRFLPVVARISNKQSLAMVFRRFAGSAASLVVETSPDLVTWSSQTTNVFRSGPFRNLVDGTGTAEVRYQQPGVASGQPFMFMRARAVQSASPTLP